MKQVFKITSNEANQSLKDFILKHISNKALKSIKRDGEILVNQCHQSVRYNLKQEDVVEVIFPKEKSLIIPSNISLKIVYEDNNYLIIDKEAGIPCIPNRGYVDNTIANGLVYYYQQNNIEATVHLVNRLDKDTSGLMLVAKNKQAHYLLSKDIKQVKRIYHCLVEGTLVGKGTINKPIIKDEDSIKRIVSDMGKDSITHYQVIENYKDSTLVQCELETGRTHQIRVHMASIGYPLVGDNLYGSIVDRTYYLNSIYLSFVHPFTNKLIEIRK